MDAPSVPDRDAFDAADDAPVPLPPEDVVVPPAVAEAPPTRRRRRFDVKLLVASLAIAFGLVLILYGLAKSVTGSEVTDLPSAIEDITPAPDAVQVLQQTQVIVDLAEGYEAELTIDDVPLATVRLDEVGDLDVTAGQQVELPPGAVFEPGNATLTYTPGEGAPIDRFDPGTHRVLVVYWKSLEGRETARSYNWTFEVI